MNLVFEEYVGRLEPLQEIVKECGKDLFIKRGLDHWFPPPNISVMEKLKKNKTIYVVKEKEQLLGMVAFGTYGYINSPLYKNKSIDSTYFCRLAVHPEHQGKGIGKFVLSEIDKLTVKMGRKNVWIDVVKLDSYAIDFYLKNGYVMRGDVVWKDWYGKERYLVLLEKEINNIGGI